MFLNPESSKTHHCHHLHQNTNILIKSLRISEDFTCYMLEPTKLVPVPATRRPPGTKKIVMIKNPTESTEEVSNSYDKNMEVQSCYMLRCGPWPWAQKTGASCGTAASWCNARSERLTVDWEVVRRCHETTKLACFFWWENWKKLHQIQIDMLKGNKKKACNQRSHWVGSTWRDSSDSFCWAYATSLTQHWHR